MDSNLLSSFIGVGGVVIGLLLSELMRRRSRIEKFSEVYFSKRIEAYEKMYEEFNGLSGLFSDLKELTEPTEIKMKVWQEQVLKFLNFTDMKALFIDEKLTVHLGMVLIGAGGFLEGNSDWTEREIYAEFKESKLLIRDSLGLRSIERNLHSTAKSKVSSGYIEYFEKVKEQMEASKKRSR